ncbi:hypothetical protein PC129_g4898 [Phytophthora cactorum]|uniref:Uncharacterized protein n=1 Tax=Phytophthora cactorum TaxID=29920 RepID=A0A8T1INC9_9STRA|nr:hypothetical protein PC129_g4898 [Phytophthora cactorum]
MHQTELNPSQVVNLAMEESAVVTFSTPEYA